MPIMLTHRSFKGIAPAGEAPSQEVFEVTERAKFQADELKQEIDDISRRIDRIVKTIEEQDVPEKADRPEESASPDTHSDG